VRILLIVVYYLPNAKSSAKLIHDLADEFCRLGHAVTVLAPDAGLASDSEFSREGGIDVLRIRTGKIDGASKVVRLYNEARLSAVLWRKGEKFFQNNKFDLIVWYSPSIFFGLLVKKLKNLFGCSSYLILRDIFPQWAIDIGVLKEGVLSRFFRRREIEQYEAADMIGVQSPGELASFLKNNPREQHRLEVLYNWTKLDEMNVPACNYRERFGLKGKVVFFYGGNIGVAQDMDNIIRLAESLADEPEAYFLLVGDGSEVARLKKIISDKKLTNIAIYGAVDQQRYLAMVAEFDVGLISLDRKFKTPNFPGKMLSYMGNSIPILASVNRGNDLKEIVEEKLAGLVSINGDDVQFRANALRLIKDGGLRRQLGANARGLLESNFAVSKAAGQILAHFKKLDRNAAN